MNEKLRKIVNHYGLETQLKYFQSEIFELNEAIIKERNIGCFEGALDNILRVLSPLMNTTYVDKGREHIKEEIADVMVMLKQFQLYFNISSDEIKEVMRNKVARQVYRISKEEKKNDK